MTTQFKPKNRLRFPNQWAADSFLLKLKSSRTWTYVPSCDGRGAKLDLKGGGQSILIGLNKEMSFQYVDLNGESLGRDSDAVWKEIFDYGRRYNC